MRLSRSLSADYIRSALMGAAGILAAGAIPPANAAPLRRISVEVALQGVSAIAAHVRNSLPQHLARELAENPVEGYPPGSRLVVRVTEVFLANEPGVRSGSFSEAFTMPDALEGEVLLLDARGAVMARKRVSGRSPPASGGFVASPYNESRRMEALMQNFAYWTVRDLR